MFQNNNFKIKKNDIIILKNDKKVKALHDFNSKYESILHVEDIENPLRSMFILPKKHLKDRRVKSRRTYSDLKKIYFKMFERRKKDRRKTIKFNDVLRKIVKNVELNKIEENIYEEEIAKIYNEIKKY